MAAVDRATKVGEPAAERVALGVAWGLLAVLIWSGWFVLTRLSLVENLSATISSRPQVRNGRLAPFSRRAEARFRMEAAAPIVTGCAGGGGWRALRSGRHGGTVLCPASHGSALTPGVMPLWVALLSVLLLKEALPMRRKLGLLLILCGVIAIAGIGVIFSEGRQWIGHLLFLTAS